MGFRPSLSELAIILSHGHRPRATMPEREERVVYGGLPAIARPYLVSLTWAYEFSSLLKSHMRQGEALLENAHGEPKTIFC